MSRNLDPTLAASLSAGVIKPVIFVQITFNSGVEYIWSGIGDYDFNGHTFKGVGDLGSIGPIGEGSTVKADGTTVTLSGIGYSDIDVPSPSVPAPPFSPPSGQSVAWSFPSVSTAGPGLVGATGGSASATANGRSGGTGVLTMDKSRPLGNHTWFAQWSSFAVPPEIPFGAEIVGVYGVVTCEANGMTFFTVSLNGSNTIVGSGSSVVPLATFYSAHADVLPASIYASVDDSLFSDDIGEVATLDFVGLAVYYIGTPVTKTSLIYEALQDVRMGAPAKIWYGLMASDGSLLGTPYLVFSGTVDKPTVQVDEKSASITLALENRLVNLQRANQRRYTAADQKLAYPTDMAFNWIETLNDVSLRWGGN